jgi:pimeloyl-ACP methyl ester carboxylesterase
MATAPALRDARVARAFLALTTRLAGERFASAAERTAVLRALSRSVTEAVRAGPGGALADIGLLGRPWDVDPGQLRAPCLVLHATNDPVVPAAHAAWYGRHLPRAHVELVPAHAHIAFLVGQARRIVAALGHPAAFERLQTDRYKP